MFSLVILQLGNQICSQDFLGISSAPIQSRRLEWSFRRRRWISTERRSKHIYGTRQVKNVSEQLLLLITEVLLEKLFGFTTSADRKQFQSIGRWLNELHSKKTTPLFFRILYRKKSLNANRCHENWCSTLWHERCDYPRG